MSSRPGPDPARRRRARRRRLALGLGLLGVLTALELGARRFGEALGFPRARVWELRAFVGHGATRFVPRAYKGWVFEPGVRGVNAEGFLDRSHPVAKPAGVLRIACLGGSTTAGSTEQGRAATYPARLEQVLNERAAVPVEVLNFGVSGWTSAETLANYFLTVQDHAPDLVLYHHAANDALPRLRSDFRSDYTHFTRPWQAPRFGPLRRFFTRWSDLYCWLQLRTWEFELLDLVSTPPGTRGLERPTAASALPFARNARTVLDHVQAAGGRAVLLTMPWDPGQRSTALDQAVGQMIDEHNEIARTLARRRGYALLDLAREADPKLRAEFVDLVHLSPAGRALEAAWIAERLLAQGLVPAR